LPAFEVAACPAEALWLDVLLSEVVCEAVALLPEVAFCVALLAQQNRALAVYTAAKQCLKPFIMSLHFQLTSRGEIEPIEIFFN
jgi:hypothetical protein